MQLKNLCFSELVNSDFLRLLVLIQRTKDHYLHPARTSLSTDRLILHLNQTYMEPWTVGSMAAFCGISSDHLAHLFKSATNTSPMRYLNRLRIEKAQELLTVTDLQIQEIAALVGYSDGLYFSRIFKKMTGLSPLSYRNQQK